MIDFSSLMLPVQARKRLQSDEEVIKHSWIRVHAAVKKPNLLVSHVYLPQTKFKFAKFFVIEFACGQGEVSHVLAVLVKLLV